MVCNECELIELEILSEPDTPLELEVDFEGEVVSGSTGEEYQNGYDKGKTDGYEDGHEAGYTEGVEKAHSDYINPEWTNWGYFSLKNNRNSLVSKLKYSDTSKGITFESMFYACSELTTIPDIDTSNGTIFCNMFYQCATITSIPELDTSKGTNFQSMFRYCGMLTSIPELDTSNGIHFGYMFSNCEGLTTIPNIDTSKGTNFQSMCSSNKALKSVPTLNVSNATNLSEIFARCSALTDVSFDGVIPVSISFLHSPLTLESAINVITHLKNYTGTDKGFSYTVTFSATTWGYLDAEGNASPNGNSWREYINDLGWNAS